MQIKNVHKKVVTKKVIFFEQYRKNHSTKFGAIFVTIVSHDSRNVKWSFLEHHKSFRCKYTLECETNTCQLCLLSNQPKWRVKSKKELRNIEGTMGMSERNSTDVFCISFGNVRGNKEHLFRT